MIRRASGLLFSMTLAVIPLVGCGGGDTGTGGSGGTGTTSTSSSTTTTTTSTGTATGGSGGTGGAVIVGEPGYVGLACTDDAQCGPQGHCIQYTEHDGFFHGSPAGGYCTLSCEADAECPDPGSHCMPTGGVNGGSECVLGCEFGTPAFDYGEQPLDPNKCHGREDVGCFPQFGDYSLCMPMCGSDSQCPAGKVCHPLLTVCVDEAPPGKQFGEECDIDLQDCAGHCMRLTGTQKQTICTNLCVLGGAFEESLDCGGIDNGWCIARGADAPASGLGDRGYCVPSCQTQEDCRTPDFFCVARLPASTGLCMPAVECTTDADCTLPETNCTTTTLGQFCLSQKYPLGNLTP